MNVPRWVWVVAGLSLGAVAVAVQERAAAPAGGTVPLGERFAAFAAEVQAGMAEREAELRDALGLDGRHDAVDAHTLSAPAPHAPAPTGPQPAASAPAPELQPAPAHTPALPSPRTPDPNES